MKIIIVMCLLFSNLSWASDNDVNHDIKSDVGISNQINNDLIDRAVRLVNQRKSYKAVEILQSDVFKEDANGQFWLGVALYHSGDHFIAGDAFLKSANLGNPWAMAVLGVDNVVHLASPCEYLGWECDKKWNDKAIDIWKGLAEQGDPDALYAYTLAKEEWFEYVPFYGYRRFLDRVEQAIPNGGGYDFLNQFSWDAEDKIKYARMAAEQGYAPAMGILYAYRNVIGEEEANKWVNKAMKLGYYEPAYGLYVIYFNRGHRATTKVETIELLKKAYYYSVISALLKGGGYDYQLTTRILQNAQSKDVKDENGYFVEEVLITKAEQAEIEQQAKDFLKGVEINLFLTKNSSDLFTF